MTTTTFGSYTVKFNGVESDLWEQVQLENTLDMNVDNAQIQFPDAETATATLGQTVKIYRDGVPKWSGIVTSTPLHYEGNNQMRRFVASCKSNKIYLAREIFVRNMQYTVSYGGANHTFNFTASPLAAPPSSFAADILTDILACQYSPVLTTGTIASPSPHVVIVVSQSYALKFFDQVCQGAQWEARFNANDTVDFGPQVGSFASSVRTFSEGQDIVVSDYEPSIDSMINFDIALGAGGAKKAANGADTTQSSVTASDPSSFAQYGRWAAINSFPNVADLYLLDNYASALLEDLDHPVKNSTMEVVDLVSGVTFRVGDVITVNNPTNNVSFQEFRIVKESVQFDASGHEKVTLTISQNFHMYSLTHLKVLQLADVLNNLTNYGQQATSLYTENPNYLAVSTQAPL